MQYTRKIVDLDTGEASWVDLGDHRPFSEVATALGVGPREFRRLLLAMTLVSPEWDELSKQFRHRLTPEAVASGLGIRHDNKGFYHNPERTPFDVLSPMGVEYVRDNLKKARALLARRSPPAATAEAALAAFEAWRGRPLNPEGKVRWLTQHYPSMTHAQVAELVGITRQAVSKFIASLEKQIRVAKATARKSAGWIPQVHGGGSVAMAA